MAAKGDEIVRAGLRALVADDACLCAGAGLGLQPEDTPEPRSRRAPFSRVLERKRRLRRVLQGDPQTFQQVDEEDGLEESNDCAHQSPTRIGSDCPCGMTRSLRRTVPSLRILS